MNNTTITSKPGQIGIKVKPEVVREWVELSKLVDTYDYDNLTADQEWTLAYWNTLDRYNERMSGLLDNLAKEMGL